MGAHIEFSQRSVCEVYRIWDADLWQLVTIICFTSTIPQFKAKEGHCVNFLYTACGDALCITSVVIHISGAGDCLRSDWCSAQVSCSNTHCQYTRFVPTTLVSVVKEVLCATRYYLWCSSCCYFCCFSCMYPLLWALVWIWLWKVVGQ